MTDREYQHLYYKVNRERLKAKAKARYREHRDEYVAYAKRIRAKNRGLYREQGEKLWQWRTQHGLLQRHVRDLRRNAADGQQLGDRSGTMRCGGGHRPNSRRKKITQDARPVGECGNSDCTDGGSTPPRAAQKQGGKRMDYTTLMRCKYRYVTGEKGKRQHFETKLVCTKCRSVFDAQGYVFGFCPCCGRAVAD